MMNSFFLILSAAYIFVIFFWADSPVVSKLSVLNPFSILHIPLYGILTFFLVLSFPPGEKTRSKFRYIFPALIAIGVAILDEFYQSFIPSREASLVDVLLDILGIFLVMILFPRLPPFFQTGFPKKLKKAGIHKASDRDDDIKLKRRRL
jgi:VanZ family protein